MVKISDCKLEMRDQEEEEEDHLMYLCMKVLVCYVKLCAFFLVCGRGQNRAAGAR